MLQKRRDKSVVYKLLRVQDLCKLHSLLPKRSHKVAILWIFSLQLQQQFKANNPRVTNHKVVLHSCNSPTNSNRHNHNKTICLACQSITSNKISASSLAWASNLTWDNNLVVVTVCLEAWTWADNSSLRLNHSKTIICLVASIWVVSNNLLRIKPTPSHQCLEALISVDNKINSQIKVLDFQASQHSSLSNQRPIYLEVLTWLKILHKLKQMIPSQIHLDNSLKHLNSLHSPNKTSSISNNLLNPNNKSQLPSKLKSNILTIKVSLTLTPWSKNKVKSWKKKKRSKNTVWTTVVRLIYFNRRSLKIWIA